MTLSMKTVYIRREPFPPDHTAKHVISFRRGAVTSQHSKSMGYLPEPPFPRRHMRLWRRGFEIGAESLLFSRCCYAWEAIKSSPIMYLVEFVRTVNVRHNR